MIFNDRNLYYIDLDSEEKNQNKNLAYTFSVKTEKLKVIAIV